jgi:hypothetical protein
VLGHALGRMGLETERKGLRPECTTEPSRARKFMETERFLNQVVYECCGNC